MTNAMSACPHGMPSPGSCVECMDEGNMPPPPPPPKRKGWAVIARFDGACSGCGSPIVPGERIVLMADDTYRHVPACEKIRRTST